VPEMLGEMVESCAPSSCRAFSVHWTCTCQILGRIVLPSTLGLPFHIALVFLRVSAVLLQGAYSHTGKHMCGQRMRQKMCSFVRSHTFYFEGTELCVGPDPYRKGSITGN